MKILFYINTISHGGAERVMTNLATEMSTRGHQCILVTSYKSPWEYDLSKRVHRLSLCHFRYRDFFVRNIRTTLSLRKVLKRCNPDVVLSFMAEPNLRNIVAGLGLDIKSIISVRNDPRKEYPGVLRYIVKKLFTKANCVVFQTQEARNWFPQKVRLSSKIILNPVSHSFYRIKAENNRYGIVTMGRLASQKNHEMLIRAYSKISPETNEDLFIYGNGDSSSLVSLAQTLGVGGRVHFMGQCDYVPEVLSKSRLFVLSSDYEGLPNALMEAMAVGLPCVSTDCPCGGPRVLFPDSIHDYLSPVGDHLTFANNMKRVLTNTEEEERLARICKSASEKFRSEVIFTQWERLFYEVSRSNN